MRKKTVILKRLFKEVDGEYYEAVFEHTHFTSWYISSVKWAYQWWIGQHRRTVLANKLTGPLSLSTGHNRPRCESDVPYARTCFRSIEAAHLNFRSTYLRVESCNVEMRWLVDLWQALATWHRFSPSLPVSAALGSPWQRILAVADMSLWRFSVNKRCFN